MLIGICLSGSENIEKCPEIRYIIRTRLSGPIKKELILFLPKLKRNLVALLIKDRAVSFL